MNQSVMNWNYTEPAGWWEPAVVAQLIVAAIALFGPMIVYLISKRNAKSERLKNQKNMKEAIRTELRYLVAFYEEVWGFWNETGRYADHMLPVLAIELPPLLSNPQVWADNLPSAERKRLSALLTDVHHYNQILREIHAVESSKSKLRNQSRARKKFEALNEHLVNFGFAITPWRQGHPDPEL